jgi:hypothetical protein
MGGLCGANIEHRTSNAQHPMTEMAAPFKGSMLGVGGSIFPVGSAWRLVLRFLTARSRSYFKASTENNKTRFFA